MGQSPSMRCNVFSNTNESRTKEDSDCLAFEEAGQGGSIYGRLSQWRPACCFLSKD